jgi:hypothetical protein
VPLRLFYDSSRQSIRDGSGFAEGDNNMSAGAKLYEVRATHGIVYAVHDLGGNTFWTERTEQAARDLAKEKSLTILEQRTISRDDLLRLMGQPPALKTNLSADREPPEKAAPKPVPATVKTTRMPANFPRIEFEQLNVDPVFKAPQDDAVILKAKAEELIVANRQSLAGKVNVFCRTQAPAAPNAVDSDLLTGRQDVSRHIPRH